MVSFSTHEPQCGIMRMRNRLHAVSARDKVGVSTCRSYDQALQMTVREWQSLKL